MPSPKKKQALGRGLNALMGEAQTETGSASSDTVIDIEKIQPNPNQPRTYFNETQLQELSESIRENGVLQPLLVRKKGQKYEIIAGERRYQASKIAGIEKLPVIIRDVDDQKMLELALIENLQRSDLNPIEEVQQFLFDGKMAAGHARAILAVPFEEARIRLAQKVVDEGLSVRATENLATLFSVGDEPKKPKAVTPQSYKKAARALRQVFNTNVKVKSSRGKNKIEIEFKDEEELSQILSVVMNSAEE